MKILMLGWELPPLHSGGLGIVCHQICKELSRQNMDIDFLLPYHSEDISSDFMKITPVSSDSRYLYSLSYFYGASAQDEDVEVHEHAATDEFLPARYAKNAQRVARSKDFDVIHAHDWLTYDAGIRIKKDSGKPLVVHVHATEYDRSGGNHGDPTIRDIEYQGLQAADVVIAISNYTKDIIIREYDVDPDKVRVVHNSTDVIKPENSHHNTFNYLQEMKHHGFKVVVSVGRLTIQKGLPYLLEAMHKVVAVQPNTLLLVVGSGDMYHELIERASQLGIAKNVIFTGWIKDSKKIIPDAFSIGDVFVMPSVSEPFGVAALEAIAYGTPAIISKQSGASEVLNNIFRSDFWDSDRMADQILGIIRHDGLAQTMHENSQAEFMNLSWTESISKLIRHYEETVAMKMSEAAYA